MKANRNDSLREESQEHRGTLGRVCLSFRHVADHRQFKHLSLIRFQQQNEPDNKATEPDHRPYQQGEKTQQGKVHDDAQPDPENPPAHVEEYALPCVEPDEPAAVVRLNHEEEYRGNDRDVSQHSGDVIGESRTGAGGDDHAAPSACCACRCAIGNLCATHVTKRHEVFSELEIGNPRSVARMRSAQRCGKVTESGVRGNLSGRNEISTTQS